MILNIPQTSFTGGEIDWEMHHKIDQAKRATALAKLRNMYVQKNGVISTRGGTVSRARAKYDDKKFILIPFVFNQNEKYVMEFGDGYIRLHTPEGTIVDELGQIYEIFTSYWTDILADIRYQQSADILYLVDGNGPTQELIRKGHADWELKEFVLRDGPFLPFNTEKESTAALATSNINTDVSAQVNIPTSPGAGSGGGTAVIPGQPLQLIRRLNQSSVLVDNQQIYVSAGEVIGVADFITNFNANNTLGLQASYSQDLIIFLLPAGGPLNIGGQTITVYLKYRFQYQGVTQAYSEYTRSGVFSGSAGNGIGEYYFTSSKDILTPEHTNALFKIEKQFQEQRLDYGITANTDTTYILCKNDWRMTTQGSWAGLLVLQISRDRGQTWLDYRTTKSPSTSNPFNENVYGDLEEEEVVFLRAQTRSFSGTLNLILSVSGFRIDVIVRIKQVLNSQEALCVVEKNDVGAITATQNWAEGAISAHRGYPSQILIHEERLALAANRHSPFGLWLSQTGIQNNFGTSSPLLATDAIALNVWSRNKSILPRINGLLSLGELIVFTNDSTMKLASAGILSPDSISLKPVSSEQSSKIAPIIAGNGGLYLTSQHTDIKSLDYTLERDNLTPSDKTVWAAHLLRDHKILSIAYQRAPDSIVWLVRDDGKLISFTYNEEQHIEGFALHETDGEFEYVCVIPGEGYDQVWLAVKRGDKRYIETLENLRNSVDIKEQIHVDCAMTYRGAPADIIIGLGHLEGKTITGLADGLKITPRQVVGGQITLDAPAEVVHVGLPYICEAEGLEPAINDPELLGKKTRTVGITARFAGTCGGLLGADDKTDCLEKVMLGNDGNNRLAWGEYSVKTEGESGKSKFYFKQDEPFPATICGVIVETGVGV